MNFERNKGIIKGLDVGINRNFTAETIEDLDHLFKIGELKIALEYEKIEKEKYEIRKLIAAHLTKVK